MPTKLHYRPLPMITKRFVSIQLAINESLISHAEFFLLQNVEAFHAQEAAFKASLAPLQLESLSAEDAAALSALLERYNEWTGMRDQLAALTVRGACFCQNSVLISFFTVVFFFFLLLRFARQSNLQERKSQFESDKKQLSSLTAEAKQLEADNTQPDKLAEVQTAAKTLREQLKVVMDEFNRDKAKLQEIQQSCNGFFAEHLKASMIKFHIDDEGAAALDAQGQPAGPCGFFSLSL